MHAKIGPEMPSDDLASGLEQVRSSDRGDVERLLRQVRSHLLEGGPAVVASAVVAFVDDEGKTDPAEHALTPERAAKVRNLIRRYRNWFEAYWHERVTRSLADEAEARPEGSLERDDLYNLLGALLGSRQGG